MSLTRTKSKQKVKQTRTPITWKEIKRQKVLLFWAGVMMIYGVIFYYLPLAGWAMAFQNYKPQLGILHSEFVGLQKFRMLFSDVTFLRVIRNTLAMGVINLVATFVTAIVFAILLNEIKSLQLKKITQTVSYLPHFLSWIIVCSLISKMLSTNDGAVNNVLMKLGLIKEPLLFLGDQKYFWWITTFANIWKETGWNSIIYIAAIAGIDQSLYEAAELDGAGRFRKMWHVTLPGIKSTIIVLLIMNLGWVMNASFEVPYILGSGLLQDVSQTIDIFVFKYGIFFGNYSLATAAGIFKSVISLFLVFSTNAIANKMGESSLM